jgi:PAS domain S-box-containing protein
MKRDLDVLILEDSADDAELALAELRRGGFDLSARVVEGEGEFVRALSEEPPDLILSDYSMTPYSGLDALRTAQRLAPETPFIVTTGSINEETAVSCMRAGAWDYILKDRLSRLPLAVTGALDLAETRRARLAAEAQVRMWADAFTNCAHGIALGDPATNTIAACNPAFAAMCGRPAPEIVGRPILSVYAPEDHARVGDAIRRADAAGRVSYDARMVRADGSLFPVQMDVVSVRDAEGRIVHRVATAQDISERQEAGKALERSEERFRALVEASFDWIWEVDAEGRYVYASPRVSEFLGYRPEELLGRTPFDLMPDDEAARVGALFGEIAASRRPFASLENVNLHRDGRPVVLETTGIPVFGPQGEYRGYRGVDRDVTARRAADDELRRHRQRLEELVRDRTVELEAANRELEAFSYSVSHDLRAPIRAIDGFAKLLVRGHAASLDAEGIRLLGVVGESAQRMAQLIEDLLRFSRAGREEIHRGPVDMRALAEEAWGEVAAAVPLAPAGPVALVLGELPHASGDVALLRQVWTNLLSNAFKFSASRAAPRVVVSGECRGGEFVYSVADNGAGFDPAYGHRLFQVFQRLHSAKEFPGTGVGLALVHRIVTRHGGRVWAEGCPGEGATFSFALPAPGSAAR